jgi:hypothetical protein
VLTFFIIASCSSDDDNNTENQTLSNAELIIGSWTWSAQSENGVDLGPLSECELLETFIYDGSQVEQIDYSGSLCQQIFSSVESYSIMDSMLIFSDIDDPTDSYSEEIIELNETTLKLRYEENFNNENYILIDTYTRVE